MPQVGGCRCNVTFISFLRPAIFHRPARTLPKLPFRRVRTFFSRKKMSKDGGACWARWLASDRPLRAGVLRRSECARIRMRAHSNAPRAFAACVRHTGRRADYQVGHLSSAAPARGARGEPAAPHAGSAGSAASWLTCDHRWQMTIWRTSSSTNSTRTGRCGAQGSRFASSCAVAQKRNVDPVRARHAAVRAVQVNSRFLYDVCLSHALEWPSLTVQMLPTPEGTDSKSEKEHTFSKVSI